MPAAPDRGRDALAALADRHLARREAVALDASHGDPGPLLTLLEADVPTLAVAPAAGLAALADALEGRRLDALHLFCAGDEATLSVGGETFDPLRPNARARAALRRIAAALGGETPGEAGRASVLHLYGSPFGAGTRGRAAAGALALALGATLAATRSRGEAGEGGAGEAAPDWHAVLTPPAAPRRSDFAAPSPDTSPPVTDDAAPLVTIGLALDPLSILGGGAVSPVGVPAHGGPLPTRGTPHDGDASSGRSSPKAVPRAERPDPAARIARAPDAMPARAPRPDTPHDMPARPSSEGRATTAPARGLSLRALSLEAWFRAGAGTRAGGRTILGLPDAPRLELDGPRLILAVPTPAGERRAVADLSRLGIEDATARLVHALGTVREDWACLYVEGALAATARLAGGEGGEGSDEGAREWRVAPSAPPPTFDGELALGRLYARALAGREVLANARATRPDGGKAAADALWTVRAPHGGAGRGAAAGGDAAAGAPDRHAAAPDAPDAAAVAEGGGTRAASAERAGGSERGANAPVSTDGREATCPPDRATDRVRMADDATPHRTGVGVAREAGPAAWTVGAPAHVTYAGTASGRIAAGRPATGRDDTGRDAGIARERPATDGRSPATIPARPGNGPERVGGDAPAIPARTASARVSAKTAPGNTPLPAPGDPRARAVLAARMLREGGATRVRRHAPETATPDERRGAEAAERPATPPAERTDGVGAATPAGAASGDAHAPSAPAVPPRPRPRRLIARAVPARSDAERVHERPAAKRGDAGTTPQDAPTPPTRRDDAPVAGDGPAAPGGTAGDPSHSDAPSPATAPRPCVRTGEAVRLDMGTLAGCTLSGTVARWPVSLPDWATLDAATGTVSGTVPGNAGPFVPLTIAVANASGATATLALVLAVHDAAGEGRDEEVERAADEAFDALHAAMRTASDALPALRALVRGEPGEGGGRTIERVRRAAG